MKSLIRMYHHQGRGVIFYENAAVPTRRKHAAISAIPMPLDVTAEAPAYFRVSLTFLQNNFGSRVYTFKGGNSVIGVGMVST